MKVLLFTGNHPRHLYVASELRKAGLLSGIVMETREDFVPQPNPLLPEQDRINFIKHFALREQSETRFFGSADNYDFSDIPVCRTTAEQLNGDEVKRFVDTVRPDAVISFGVHKLKNSLLERLPKLAWNIHGGLSPWYRGNITLFWPFYFLQPNWVGMTIHQLTSSLDGGPVIHHAAPELARGDGIHDVACKAVKQSAYDLVRILERVRDGAEIVGVEQKTTGKLFTSTDWHPRHLRVIYNLFNDDIVDRYLDGELGHEEPQLVRAL